MFPPEGPSNESLFNITLIGSVFASSVSILVVLFCDYSKVAAYTILVGAFLLLLTYLIASRNKKLRVSSFIVSTLVNFIFFPIVFLTSGAVNGGMPSYFILGLVFTILLITGRGMFIMLGAEIVFYGFVYYLAFKYPNYIIDFNNTFDVYRASYAYMVISALLIGTVIKLLLTEYQKEGIRVKSLLNQVHELSIKDPLTNIYNRRYMLEFLENQINQVKRDNSPLSIIMFDIDYFKKINDSYGHLAGDEVLQQICNIFLGRCRKEDIVSRYGGEEFLVILPSTDVKMAKNLAEDIRLMISENVKIEDEKVTISGGVVQYNSDFDIVEFIKRVDEKLYIAKTNGRNQIVI